MLDPGAWANVRPLSFPAQIRVKWDQLKILENANAKFAFLGRRVCKLTDVQTASILSALKDAPFFKPMIAETSLIPDAEKRFIKFLNAKGIAYIRFSQTLDDFSQALKLFKAKRPDFIIFLRNPLLVEVKPYRCDKEVTLEIDEIEKLRQLELLTHMKTTIVFPADSDGIEWKSVDPLRVWARGARKMRYQKSILSIEANELAELVLE